MAATTSATAVQRLKARSEWVVPAAAVGLVFVMLVPLPAPLLDVLLTISITASVLVLLSAIYVLKPVQFSVFPSLLLLLTLFRLALNLSSSRLILLHGSTGPGAAGQVIEAFGQFVVGGNYVVGFVIFLALIAIQYLVVSHGAVRTAEVSARFTLDALPGKQMAIDADLNAGLIDEREARSRREQIARDAEFHGAMDGAARFNQRDALASVLITAINIIAGLLIGILQQGMPFTEALKTYTILTVGDGLVTIIPSLLVSIAGGIVLTRSASDDPLAADLRRQLLSRRQPLLIAAVVLGAMALIPALPKAPFLIVAAILGYAGWRMPAAAAKVEEAPAPPPTLQSQLEGLLKLEELSVEVGYGLVRLVDEKQGGQLLPRIRSLRKHLALQLGFIVPPIHITDNLRLNPNEYVVLLRGAEIARWEMAPEQLLAISSEPDPPPLAGTPTREPAFGVAALWIAPALREQALAGGYAVVDPTSALATHLAELVKQNAHELLTRQETKRLLDALSESQPKLVEELVPKVLSLGEVQKVLQQLLREQVSIRDLHTILETLLDAAAANKNPVLLVEGARQALRRGLVQPLLGEDGKLTVVTLDPVLEDEISRAVEPAAAHGPGLQPAFLRRVVEGLRRVAEESAAPFAPVLLCGSPARFYLRRLVEPFLPKLVILSPGEIPPRVAVQSLGSVR